VGSQRNHFLLSDLVLTYFKRWDAVQIKRSETYLIGGERAERRSSKVCERLLVWDSKEEIRVDDRVGSE